MSTTEPSIEKYEFDRGDRVRVDWTNGSSPLDEVIATVSGISHSGGNVIVAAETADDQYPENSIYGGTHDAAPAWISSYPLSQ